MISRISLFTFFALYLTTALAFPTLRRQQKHQRQGRSFKSYIHKTSNSQRDGPTEYLKALNKHGISLPEAFSKAFTGSWSSPDSGFGSGYGSPSETENPFDPSESSAAETSLESAFESALAVIASAVTSYPETSTVQSVVTVYVTTTPVASVVDTISTYSAVAASSAASASASASASADSKSSKSSSSSSSTTSTNSTSTGTGSDEGEVAATPDSNAAEYVSDITIGGQVMTLDFDTGSADLWVFSSLQSSGTDGHDVYDPDNSSTFSYIDGATFKISYGDGSSASGKVGTDVVDIGGATVSTQAVELATSVSGSFVTDTTNSGLVGLGFSSINTVEPEAQKTFFENIMDDLDEPLFTADLQESGSTYEFGSIDTTKYTGDLTYVTVDDSLGYWGFQSTRFKVGNGSVQHNTIGSLAIADTGTSLMLVDSNVAETYYESVDGSEYSDSVGGYIFPCDSELPNFSIGLGDSYFAEISSDLLSFSEVGSGYCYGGLQDNSGSDIQIYGDVFFRGQFVVFDGGNTRLGFAAQ